MHSSGEESESSSGADQKHPRRASAMETSASGGQRSCADCKTTKTPLWRGGPAGPKSLCNACGIRYRKKRRALMALDNRDEKCKRGRTKGKLGVSFKLRLLGLGRDAALQRYLLQKKKKLAEEEEAAVLLMALSCAPVNA